MSRLTSKTFILATVLVPLLGAPAIAFSLDAKTMGRINHVVECVTWKINDDPRYARYCLPTHVTDEQLKELQNFTGKIEATSPTTSSCYTPPSSNQPSNAGSIIPDCDYD